MIFVELELLVHILSKRTLSCSKAIGNPTDRKSLIVLLRDFPAGPLLTLTLTSEAPSTATASMIVVVMEGGGVRVVVVVVIISVAIAFVVAAMVMMARLVAIACLPDGPRKSQDVLTARQSVPKGGVCRGGVARAPTIAASLFHT